MISKINILKFISKSSNQLKKQSRKLKSTSILDEVEKIYAAKNKSALQKLLDSITEVLFWLLKILLKILSSLKRAIDKIFNLLFL